VARNVRVQTFVIDLLLMELEAEEQTQCWCMDRCADVFMRGLAMLSATIPMRVSAHVAIEIYLPMTLWQKSTR
jgi:hypothetical protein